MFKTKIHIHVAISCGKSYWKLITSVFNGKSMRDESFEHANPGLTWSFKPNSGMKHIKSKSQRRKRGFTEKCNKAGCKFQIMARSPVSRGSLSPCCLAFTASKVRCSDTEIGITGISLTNSAWRTHGVDMRPGMREVNNPKHVTSKFRI